MAFPRGLCGPPVRLRSLPGNRPGLRRGLARFHASQMHWPFRKYHGLGNDFLVGPHSRRFTARTAARLCERRSGAGADGVMLILPARAGGHALRIFNSNGSPALFSGNGIRCAAAYLMDAGLPGEGPAPGPLELRPPPGPVCCWREEQNLAALRFEVRALRKSDVPPVRRVEPPPALRPHVTAAFHAVLGNPHFVMIRADPSEPPAAMAAACELLRLPGRRFPDGINVSVISPMGSGRYRMRTWERGVGRSRSCASAACATLWAGAMLGLLPAAVRFEQDGGGLDVSHDAGELTLLGPIAFAFEGVAEI